MLNMPTKKWFLEASSGVQGGRMDRAIRVAPGKQKRLWPGEPPISAQDGEQLRGKHRFAIFTTLAVAHVDDAARAVDVGDPQAGHLQKPLGKSGFN